MRYERSTAIIERHQKLLTLVEQGTHSSPHLAKDLGVSEQTVYRDILYLRRQGHQIQSIRMSSSWAYRLVASPDQGQRSQMGAP